MKEDSQSRIEAASKTVFAINFNVIYVSRSADKTFFYSAQALSYALSMITMPTMELH